MAALAALEVGCPDCGEPVAVELTLRVLRCDCTRRDHVHAIVRHNAEEAVMLHRIAGCLEVGGGVHG